MNQQSEKKRKQQAILSELENIKTLLDDDQEPLNTINDIPILQEMVDEVAPSPPPPSSDHHSPLTDQQALFDSPTSPPPSTAKPAAKPQENPFLPQHIRERVFKSCPRPSVHV